MKRTIDEDWEEIHANQEWGKYPTEQVIRFVANNFYKVYNRNEVRMLDFGCGGGAHTWYLAREGFDVYAFDGSESAVRNTKKYLEREGVVAKVDVYDAFEIPYEDNFFDAVIDSVCIYANRIDDIRYMYQKVYDILKDGGRLYSSSFSTRTAGFGTGDEIESNTYKNIPTGILHGRGTAHFFTSDEIRNILEEVGFHDVAINTLEYDDNRGFVSMFNVTAQK